MPCLIRLLTPDGLHPVPFSAESLNEAAQYEPHDGVYTVTNTYGAFNVLKFDAHLDRLANSAQRVGIPLMLDRMRLRAALRSMIEEADYGDVRFRITVGRDQPDALLLSIEPFRPPTEAMIAAGVRCATVPDSARANAAAKTTGWMHDRKAFTLPADTYEGLTVDGEGRILEGFSSNFYAIRDGVLYTASEGVLAGISQQIVFEVASGVVTVQRQALRTNDLPQIEEAFISSASRGIVPVTTIDGHPVGAGVPGALTQALRERYRAWVDAHLEPL